MTAEQRSRLSEMLDEIQPLCEIIGLTKHHRNRCKHDSDRYRTYSEQLVRLETQLSTVMYTIRMALLQDLAIFTEEIVQVCMDARVMVEDTD